MCRGIAGTQVAACTAAHVHFYKTVCVWPQLRGRPPLAHATMMQTQRRLTVNRNRIAHMFSELCTQLMAIIQPDIAAAAAGVLRAQPQTASVAQVVLWMCSQQQQTPHQLATIHHNRQRQQQLLMCPAVDLAAGTRLPGSSRVQPKLAQCSSTAQPCTASLTALSRDAGRHLVPWRSSRWGTLLSWRGSKRGTLLQPSATGFQTQTLPQSAAVQQLQEEWLYVHVPQQQDAAQAASTTCAGCTALSCQHTMPKCQSCRATATAPSHGPQCLCR
jgi:hypothetical protein